MCYRNGSPPSSPRSLRSFLTSFPQIQFQPQLPTGSLHITAEVTGLLNEAAPRCLNKETLGVRMTMVLERDQRCRQECGVTRSPPPGELQSHAWSLSCLLCSQTCDSHSVQMGMLPSNPARGQQSSVRNFCVFCYF